MVHSEALIGDTEYLMLYARCRINLCRIFCTFNFY